MPILILTQSVLHVKRMSCDTPMRAAGGLQKGRMEQRLALILPRRILKPPFESLKQHLRRFVIAQPSRGECLDL